jgi:hypothetical protein
MDADSFFANPDVASLILRHLEPMDLAALSLAVPSMNRSPEAVITGRHNPNPDDVVFSIPRLRRTAIGGRRITTGPQIVRYRNSLSPDLYNYAEVTKLANGHLNIIRFYDRIWFD